MERIEKPWGYEILLTVTPQYAIKFLFVNAGSRLSLQYHKIKDETLLVLDGSTEITVGNSGDFIVGRGSEPIRIEPKTKHRIEAITACQILEVSTPVLGDVVRLEDDYGRVSSCPR